MSARTDAERMYELEEELAANPNDEISSEALEFIHLLWKDHTRLDWLQSNGRNDARWLVIGTNPKMVTRLSQYTHDSLGWPNFHSDVRKAIDAAMDAEEAGDD